MKKYILITSIICMTFGIYSFVDKDSSSSYVTIIPSNAFGTGTIVTPTLFTTWLNTGVTPVTNVFVKPANSLTFGDVPNLDFYRWTEQMYLWLLSPTPSSYGSCGGFVFTSPEFYDVTQADPITGLRTLQKHTCGTISLPSGTSTSKNSIKSVDDLGREYETIIVNNSMNFDVKGTTKGKGQLPIFINRQTNTKFEIDESPKSNLGNQLIYNKNGNKVEIGNIKVKKNDVIFYDLKNQIIVEPKLILSLGSLDINSTTQKFILKDNSEVIIFTDLTGNLKIIAPDQMQATGDVLMAKNGSLIYYNSMVNDVYAVFLTMVKNGVLPSTTKFPTTQAELTVIQNYAALKNITILEPNALAMELKTSWIETTNLPNVADYITVQATIPNYILTSTNVWTRSGTKTATLAMVGMHVVGSVKNHPEMIWGSFEHINNTPNRAYTYTNSSNVTTNVVADTNFGVGTPWLFSSATATVFNVSHMTMAGANITANSPFTISGSDTQRTKPFAFGTSLLGLTEAKSNAQIIATNTDVNTRLVGNDIRKKYYHIGSTWNISATNITQVGTNQLSNSTMETYSQFNTVVTPSANCFSCHFAGGTPNNQPSLLSHVFNSKPLVP